MGEMMTALERQVDQQAAEWNRHVMVGDEVEYRSFPHAIPQIFRTRSKATVLSGHTAVVFLEGKAGCVAISACQPVAPMRITR
jgi:hypothetical protein